MPTTIVKNQQSDDHKSAKPVLKLVERGVSNIERKIREMERILNKFPAPSRPTK